MTATNENNKDRDKGKDNGGDDDDSSHAHTRTHTSKTHSASAKQAAGPAMWAGSGPDTSTWMVLSHSSGGPSPGCAGAGEKTRSRPARRGRET